MKHDKFKNQHLAVGFTLIELMVVVAIIALLAMVAAPNFMKYLHKAKRSEVYLNLGAIYTAEKLYWSEHGSYSAVLTGPGGIGWQPDGEPQYSYGFAGAAGANYVVGQLKAAGNEFSQYTHADKNSFVVAAVGDIDGDGQNDIVTINEKRQLKIVQDDCE